MVVVAALAASCTTSFDPLQTVTIGDNPGDDIQGATVDTHIGRPDSSIGNDIFGDSSFIRSDSLDTGEVLVTGLLRFELPDFGERELFDATLRLTVATNPTADNIAFHEVLEPWQEADATWFDSTAGVQWSVPGCVTAPCIAEPFAEISGLEAAQYHVELPLTLVRGWLDENYGIAITVDGTDTLTFRSRDYLPGDGEAALIDQRPQLTVRYFGSEVSR